MARSPFSPSWHSVASLRPRLTPYARIQRVVFRGRPWYVVQDQTGGRVYRLSAAAYAFLAGMDGNATVQSLWEQANTSELRDACTQPEIVDLLSQLHGADLLQTDAVPDSAASLERHNKKRSEMIRQWLMNPMSLKFPLVNPDRFLTVLSPYFAWCFGPIGAVLWALAVIPALFLAGVHWTDLTHNLSDRVLSSSNLLVMACVYPVVKLLHELGHGFAAKRWGGAVRELGLMFLIFAPVPYVEASSSAAFPSKYRRATVAAAGMLVELFLAAIALHVWLLAEPGVMRGVAFNVMVICGVSTLVVNGNPLLRYDGYYILSDLIEIPNLAQRGQAWWTYLIDRYAFGSMDATRPDETPSEQRWLTVYTPLAWCYRTFVTVSVIFVVAGKFFFVGTMMALWSAYGLIGAPIRKGWKHLSTAGALHRVRTRAMRRTFAFIGGLLVLLLFVPVPLHTRALGVVWLPEQAMLHAGGNGFFVRWLATPGAHVNAGQPLYVLDNAQLRAEHEVDRAKVAQAQARYDAEQFIDPTKAAISGRQLDEARETLARIETRMANLTGFAGEDGRLVVATAQDMPGRYYKKGELLGYVLQDRQLIVRAVVQQDDIDLVHARLSGVGLRLADSLGVAWTTRVIRAFPGGVDELPTAALGLNAGGTIATHPNDSKGVKTIQRVFIVDLALPRDSQPVFGERVQIRFDHGYEPMALQAIRRLRQVFLSHFGV
ncbi:putative peptide zinc metalloprotease protein [Luteibacter rhizovicinus]|uniref:Putative peptide zinc metalloprotease protein n=1 Tax=Luteibacter rhizovicinus TaxID=242606 RepID=A0A4V2W3Y8_9GAMM|nr:peptidase M50 [Luteibacter rhizovicinus]TCV93349.1 putative peptide zinc metalloprotease protein [Luteibacter rhizovicinus]